MTADQVVFAAFVAALVLCVAELCFLVWLEVRDRRRARAFRRHVAQALAMSDHPTGRKVGPPEEWLP